MSIPCSNDTLIQHSRTSSAKRARAGSKRSIVAAELAMLAVAFAGCAASVDTVKSLVGSDASVDPSVVTLDYAEQTSFHANAAAASYTVTWSVQEGSTCGSITQAGLYTAPSVTTRCHVVAQVTTGSTTLSASAEVAVVPAGQFVNSVGINIEGISDWEAQHFFADLMKSARYFSNPWPNRAPVDSAGWPTGDANVTLATGPGNLGRSEPYKLSLTGRASVASLGGVTVSNVAYNSSTNTTTADLVIQSGQNVNISLTGTRRLPSDTTATGVTNLKIMTPGHATTDVFTQDLFARISHFTTLRFMQALGQAGTGSPANPDVDWANRQLPGWPQQTGDSGIAWEYIAMLANQADKDVWINIPYGATDDYVRKVAQLFKYGSDGVNPYTSAVANPVYSPIASSHRIYVEWVNELWNGFYTTTGKNSTAATAEYNGGNPYGYSSELTRTPLIGGLQRQARRTVEISNIFREVFGDAAMMTQIRPVFCSQFGNWATFDYPMSYLKSRYSQHLPSYYIYGLAGAPYVTVDNENQDGLTVDDVINQMSNQVHKSGGYLDLIDGFRRAADTYDPALKIMNYEGGAGNLSGHSDAAKLAAQSDPRMETIVHDLLAKWYAVSPDPFMYYTLCAGYGFGYFALTPDMSSEAGPKWAAVKEIVAGL